MFKLIKRLIAKWQERTDKTIENIKNFDQKFYTKPVQSYELGYTDEFGVRYVRDKDKKGYHKETHLDMANNLTDLEVTCIVLFYHKHSLNADTIWKSSYEREIAQLIEKGICIHSTLNQSVSLSFFGAKVYEELVEIGRILK